MKQLFFARRAIVCDFQIACKQVPFAAVGAALAQAAHYGGFCGAIINWVMCV
jgi:hypothetical protein